MTRTIEIAGTTIVVTLTRRGVGLTFRCPHCIGRLYVPFANPLDGGPAMPNSRGCSWQRTGDTFESLSLTPSVDASEGGCWHGFITNGEVT